MKTSHKKSPIIKEISIRGVRFGKNVTVIQPVNLYGCLIDSNSFIGPFVEIQNQVKIGERTRVQSHSFICSKVTVGKDCFISHGVMFINDDFTTGKVSRSSGSWKKTFVGDRVLIGTNSTVLPVKIVSDTIIGAGSVVTRDILTPGIYAGNPARKIRDLSRKSSR